jgi:hypothetical protein
MQDWALIDIHNYSMQHHLGKAEDVQYYYQYNGVKKEAMKIITSLDMGVLGIIEISKQMALQSHATRV